MVDMSARPLPRRTRDSDEFWDGCREHRLVLQRCDGCHTFRYHPMPGCRVCGSLQFAWEAVEQRGEVANFTVVHADLNPAFETPYALCVVDLDCGARMLSRMVDFDYAAVEVGLRVEVVWEDVPAADTSIPAFRPVNAPTKGLT
jgi:uncharacterized OB-fold protein